MGENGPPEVEMGSAALESVEEEEEEEVEGERKSEVAEETV